MKYESETGESMEKPGKKLKKLLIITGTTGAVYAGFKYLLPLVAPFFVGYILALVLRPSARFLSYRMRITVRGKRHHMPIGVIGGVSESRFVKAFINGAADMMSVVLIIALARSITVLMASTGLDMWILENAANALAGMSAIIFAPLSFLLYIVLSFLIPSSSGMATVSIPILGGLAHQLNFSVETMVMIYSAGNGLVNLFTPTSGAIMGGLALAKVEYSTWLKFGAKLFVALGVVCIVILTAAMVILS